MKKTTRGKPIELAYIAGFVDGEGCIGIYKRNYSNKPNWAPRYYTQVFIVNTDKNILKWVIEREKENSCKPLIGI